MPGGQDTAFRLKQLDKYCNCLKVLLQVFIQLCRAVRPLEHFSGFLFIYAFFFKAALQLTFKDFLMSFSENLCFFP